MATGTNAIAIFNDLSNGTAGSYYSMNKLKAITNLELKDYTVFKYDSSNLKKCVTYSSILKPDLTDTEKGTNLKGCNVAFKSGQIIYRIPALNGSFSGSLGKSNTPEGVYTTVLNLRDDAKIVTLGGYTYSVSNNEITGSFRVYVNPDSTTPGRVSISVWRESAVTYNASAYTHLIYTNNTAYTSITVLTKAVQGETCLYKMGLTFAILIYLVI